MLLKKDRRTLMLAVGGTLLGGLAMGQARAAGRGRITESDPRPLAEFVFTDAEGQPAGLGPQADKTLAGKALVINLWATWCPPCVEEMPALDRMQAALGPEGVAVLALSSDRAGKAAVEPFYQRTGIRHLGLWLDPRGAAARALGARGLPTTIITDRQHRERARVEGAVDWDGPEMLALIRRIAGPPQQG